MVEGARSKMLFVAPLALAVTRRAPPLGIANAGPLGAGERDLRVLHRDARDQHGVAVGVQRSFAETVDAHIARKLGEEQVERARMSGADHRTAIFLFIVKIG